MGTKISAMTAASALDGSEELPVVQGGANRKSTTQDVADLAPAPAWGDVTGTLADQTDLQAALDAKAAKAATINAQSGTTYTLVIGDAGNVVELTNAGAITLTIPPNSSVAFPIGTAIELHQGGAGTVTVAPDTGVTLVSRGSVFGLAGQEAVAVIRKVGADKWRLTGDIA